MLVKKKNYTVNHQMKLNLQTIESMGGCVYLPFEPNIPECAEFDGVVVEAALFDGYGVFAHCEKYYKINYPRLEEIQNDEQVSRTINHHRAGNRLPDDFEITLDDLALTFGEIEECEYSEYVSYIVDGLIENIGRMVVEDGVRDVLSTEEYTLHLRAIEQNPPRHLILARDNTELIELTAHLAPSNFESIVFLRE